MGAIEIKSIGKREMEFEVEPEGVFRLATWFMHDIAGRQDALSNLNVNGFLAPGLLDGVNVEASPIQIASEIEKIMQLRDERGLARIYRQLVASEVRVSIRLNGLSDQISSDPDFIKQVFDGIDYAADEYVDKVESRYGFLRHNLGVGVDVLIGLNLLGTSEEAVQNMLDQGFWATV